MLALFGVDEVKQWKITEQDSVDLMTDLIELAIVNICYERGVFPTKYFAKNIIPGLNEKCRRLMPVDAKSRRPIKLIQEGVSDALQKKYLKALVFGFCEASDGSMIEEYNFSFSYPDSQSQDVSMNVNGSGDETDEMFRCNSTTEITPDQMRRSAYKMLDDLIVQMLCLNKMLNERTVLVKLLLFDDVTPADYEPPFFHRCTNVGANNHWTKEPSRIEVGNINSKHLILALEVESVLVPAERIMYLGDPDVNDDSKDWIVCFETVGRNGDSKSDNEAKEPITKNSEDSKKRKFCVDMDSAVA